jgi:gamma-glutamylcyclotransferase (GGCT)/AIG2-like uncharacterized protein YtfP
MTPTHLFVYGTLRQDSGHPSYAKIADDATLVGRGHVRGVLYRLGWHPGAVLADQGDSWIRGELYRMHEPDRLLVLLDDYEGCGPSDPNPHRFERVATDVRLDSGEQVRAWIYVFRDSTEGAPRIDSGDWLTPG